MFLKERTFCYLTSAQEYTSNSKITSFIKVYLTTYVMQYFSEKNSGRYTRTEENLKIIRIVLPFGELEL